ncbi:low temperature requirement protein A [Actinorhabdospora filicis]|uniref:Low temperature requirement protein A n=1 Tax=Actinorhabdospora filicis TaxID=1785913 RepID=A0A9W6WB76_9ACTN|nr:low temperature requirement protein A [Actinorhabdospora filicis]
MAEVAERRVSWAELFFDLIFVFAVTQVSALLLSGHSPAGVARALVVLVPVYWVWIGTSVFINTRGTDRPLERLGVFGVGLCSLLMALAIPDAYGERGVWFGVAYLVARAIIAAMTFMGVPLLLNPVGISLFTSGPLLIVGGFLDGRARWILWGLAALIDLSTPRLTRKRLLRLKFDAPHLAERFGLLVIIALGESIVAIGAPLASAKHVAAGAIAGVAVAFVIAVGLWWVYFNYAADAVRHALATTEIKTDLVRQVLTYGHFLFIAGIIAVAVGLDEAVAHYSHRLPVAVVALLYGGCALYLGTFGYTRWAMFRKVATWRLTGAGLAVLLAPVAVFVPAIAAMGILAALLVALNAWEYRNVTRTGRV